MHYVARTAHDALQGRGEIGLAKRLGQLRQIEIEIAPRIACDDQDRCFRMHFAEVLGELGYSPYEIESLRKAGAL